MNRNQYIWHPYTQEAISSVPLHVKSAKDEYLILDDGRELIDAISSWWTITHGHCRQEIREAVADQMTRLDHVIFAGFTHDKAEEVAEKLISILPDNHKKVFFSDNGSTAVEIAVKMAIQYHYNLNARKKIVIAFEGAFHGETFGAMSVSDRHGFDTAFEPFLFEVKRIPVPRADNIQLCIDMIAEFNKKEEVAAFIFEPLVLGAGGMIMYEPNLLDQLLKFCLESSIITIADEVMTGFGRTGRILATDYCENKPDIICLAKGLSGGVLPLAITSCTIEIYNAFLSDDKKMAFYHGHSFTGNPIACAAAAASLNIVLNEAFLRNLKRIQDRHLVFVKQIKDNYPNINIRVCGTILAINFDSEGTESYFSNIKEVLIDFFLQKDVFIRPLGNVLYLMPPYCISDDSLGKVHNLFFEAINNFYVGK